MRNTNKDAIKRRIEKELLLESNLSNSEFNEDCTLYEFFDLCSNPRSKSASYDVRWLGTND